MRLDSILLLFSLCGSKPVQEAKQVAKQVKAPSVAKAIPAPIGKNVVAKNEANAVPNEKGSKGKNLAKDQQADVETAAAKGKDGGDILGGGGGDGGGLLPGQIFGFPLMTVVLVAGGGFIIWKYVLKK